ncbi:MAG: hypothetical protein ACYC9S_10095 [Leptospirales bacterium]
MEKVKSLIALIRKNEKINALDFEILDEKEKKEGKEYFGLRFSKVPSTGLPSLRVSKTTGLLYRVPWWRTFFVF